MHNNHISTTETASHFRLGDINVVLKWKHIYYEKRPQAFYKERRRKTKKIG